jgi:4'-phosphopantetheinyl transferase
MIPLGLYDIHLWTLQLDAAAPRWPEVLSNEEHLRANRFARHEDAERFRIARSNLRRLLGIYLDSDGRSIVLAATNAGRPYVVSPSIAELNFNISHSETKLFIAVGRQSFLGVDGEDRVRGRDLDDIAGLVFNAGERAELYRLAGAARADAILRGWTRKEAVAKALGQGFLTDPRSLTVPLAEGTRWRVPVPGAQAVDLADISDATSVAALAAGRMRSIPAPRALATLFTGAAPGT